MASSDGGGQGARRTGPALESMYGFVLWLVPTVENGLQATAVDVLERLVEATYTPGTGGSPPGRRVLRGGLLEQQRREKVKT